jgi:hypothetical protein
MTCRRDHRSSSTKMPLAPSSVSGATTTPVSASPELVTSCSTDWRMSATEVAASAPQRKDSSSSRIGSGS